jgi:hypothetical protein
MSDVKRLTRVEVAIKQFRAFAEDGEEALRLVLAEDSKEYTEDEVHQICTALLSEKSAIKSATNLTVKNINPNSKLDLSEFDYSKLRDVPFTKYQELFNSLGKRDHYDFEQFFATGIFEFEFNRKTGQSEHILVGIQVNNPKPINTTRIPISVAEELNRQVYNRDNPASNARYYLLKK